MEITRTSEEVLRKIGELVITDEMFADDELIEYEGGGTYVYQYNSEKTRETLINFYKWLSEKL